GRRRSPSAVLLRCATRRNGRKLHLRSAADPQPGGVRRRGRRKWRGQSAARRTEQLFSDGEQRKVRLHLALQRLVRSGPVEAKSEADARLRSALGVYPAARGAL